MVDEARVLRLLRSVSDDVSVLRRESGADEGRRPPDPGAAQRPFLLGTDAGLAVRISVIALADHAGSRVIRMGFGHRT